MSLSTRLCGYVDALVEGNRITFRGISARYGVTNCSKA